MNYADIWVSRTVQLNESVNGSPVFRKDAILKVVKMDRTVQPNVVLSTSIAGVESYSSIRISLPATYLNPVF